MNKQSIYFPGLNGLRAIAALSIVVSHLTLKFMDFGLDPHILGTLPGGRPRGFAYASVTMFFVLSGFLITYLLLTEKESGDISIRKFYWRRILRIWPLYYLYMIVVVIILLVARIPFDVNSIWLYIFFAANVPFIFNHSIYMLDHYWSLGVEEQFYIFWPWLIKKVDRWLIPVILLLLGILIGTRVVVHFFFSNALIERAFQVTRFQNLMMGGLAAVLYKKKHLFFLKITDNKITQVICWILLCLMMVNKFHVASIIDDDFIALVSVCLIIGQINVKNRVINLETKWFDFLGKISYGIYVIHMVLIYLFSLVMNNMHLASPFNYISVYGAVICATIIVSWLSYTYFEKYFLKMKSRFEVVNSSASRKANQ